MGLRGMEGRDNPCPREGPPQTPLQGEKTVAMNYMIHSSLHTLIHTSVFDEDCLTLCKSLCQVAFPEYPRIMDTASPFGLDVRNEQLRITNHLSACRVTSVTLDTSSRTCTVAPWAMYLHIQAVVIPSIHVVPFHRSRWGLDLDVCAVYAAKDIGKAYVKG